jgi:tetratricopeptide (TPR) repeat protein
LEIKTADFALGKEGYQDYRETVDLAKAGKTQGDISCQVFFVLYRGDELTPQQRTQKQEADQQVMGMFTKGMECFQTGNFQEAIAAFKKSIELKADFLEAHQNLASSYFRAGEYEKAIEAAQGALAIDKNSPQMVKLISVAYSKLGNESKALEYQDVLRTFPNAELSAEELYNLGVAEANRGRDSQAADDFRKAAQAKPEFSLAHYQLGLCCFRLQDMEGAKTELEKYLSLEPDGEYAKVAKALLANIK